MQPLHFGRCDGRTRARVRVFRAFCHHFSFFVGTLCVPVKQERQTRALHIETTEARARARIVFAKQID